MNNISIKTKKDFVSLYESFIKNNNNLNVSDISKLRVELKKISEKLIIKEKGIQSINIIDDENNNINENCMDYFYKK